ncbi:MAG: IclR family transcriptional regulator [Anaerolineae bacterium]|nr:IclR family transcriptional regulator [Anaerolineae bacterium]
MRHDDLGDHETRREQLLGTVLKAGKVLDLFTVERPEWGVTEVAASLDMPRASAYQLLATLTEIDLLRRMPNNRYRLGWRLLSFARTLLESTEFQVEAVRAMDDLAGRYRQAVYLATLDDDEVVCVTNREGELVAADTGQRLMVHASAVGKVLIAGQAWPDVQHIVERRGLPSFTGKTITHPDDLHQEWQTVRTQGYAYALEETQPNLCCVAAPIRDQHGRIVAALCVSARADIFRRHEQDLVQSVRRASHTVSRNLGYLPRPSSPTKK